MKQEDVRTLVVGLELCYFLKRGLGKKRCREARKLHVRQQHKQNGRKAVGNFRSRFPLIKLLGLRRLLKVPGHLDLVSESWAQSFLHTESADFPHLREHYLTRSSIHRFATRLNMSYQVTTRCLQVHERLFCHLYLAIQSGDD
jgi:hypothetical protein